MSQIMRPLPNTNLNLFKDVLELRSLDEIPFLESELNKQYELIKTIIEHNVSQHPFDSKMLENSKYWERLSMYTQDHGKKRQARFSETASSIERHNKTKYGDNKLSSCSVNSSLWLCDETQRHTNKIPGRTNGSQERVDTNRPQSRLVAQIQASLSSVTVIQSGHFTGRLEAKSKLEVIKRNDIIPLEFTHSFLQKLEGSTKPFYRTETSNSREYLPLEPHIHETRHTEPCSVAQFHLKRYPKASKPNAMDIFPEIIYSKHNIKNRKCFCTFSGLVLLQPGPRTEKNKQIDNYLSYDFGTTNLSTNTALNKYYHASLSKHQLFSWAQSQDLKFIIGPYAQTQMVYNVQTAEKGTSQVFKQKSQGIGTSSISSNGGSSTATSGRPAIQIESSCSFRIELPGFRSGSAPVIPVPVEPEKPEKPIKAKKRSLHRCLCTLSFSTDKKKAAVRASQTKKKKITKEERKGKETLVKEKGSDSISKYKETVEIKTAPDKKKENPCVKCWTELQKVCKKIKKDKPTELKPGLTSTNISIKPEKKKEKSKETKKQIKKEGKKEGKKETKTEIGKEPGQEIGKEEEVKAKKPPPSSVANTLQKCCRKLQFWKKDTGPLETGTHSKKESESPPAGATVYKESGAGTKSRKVPKLEAPTSDQAVAATVTPAAMEKGKAKEKGKPKEKGKAKKEEKVKAADTSTQPTPDGAEPGPVGDSTGPQFKKQGGFSGVEFYQSYDGGLMTKQQGVNIGSECSCSLEFYKMRF